MELLSDYKEAKAFELQEDRDISEKFSLGNLLRSSKSSPVKQKVPAMHFPWEKREKHTAKTTNQPKLWHMFGEVSFHLRTTEYFETESIQPILCYSERNSNIPGPPCKLFLFSTALLPPPISHTLLKNDSLWFAVLFYFSSQKMYCYSVNVFLLSYFADDFLPIFGGLDLPLVTLFASLWSPLRRLTLSLKKLGQGQTTAWLWTLTSLWSPSYGEIISKF